MSRVMYLVMDGRAHFDLDRATVCDTAETLEEARLVRPNYGTDAAIVEGELVGNELRNLRVIE
jgi:hypothetical protein